MFDARTGKYTTNIIQNLCVFACNLDAPNEVRLREIKNAKTVLNMLLNLENSSNKKRLKSAHEKASTAAKNDDGSNNLPLLNYAISLKASLNILSASDVSDSGEAEKKKFLKKIQLALVSLEKYEKKLSPKSEETTRVTKDFLQ